MYRVALPILIAIVVPMVVAGAGDDAIRLSVRAEVCVVGRDVTVADVLVFDPPTSPLRADIGDEPMIPGSGDTPSTVISHDQIEQRLHSLGVDMRRVLLGGAMTCRVTRQAAAVEEQSTSMRSLRRAPAGEPGAPRTLAQLLREHVNEELVELGGTAEVDFEQASRPFLDLSSPPFEFSIRSQGRRRLGLREFRVVIRRDGQTQRSVDVFARVRLSKDVLVAQGPLSVGTFVERDELAHEKRSFEREADIGVDQIEQAVGQQVARFVPAGQMILPTDLKSVDLVRRSRPVTVTRSGGGVQVRLTGVAMDSGSFGDTVRVRVGETRGNRGVLRAVVTGPGTVRVMEDGR